MHERFDRTVTRLVYTTEEAAFALNVSRNDFVRRFVDTKKIEPIIYDQEQKRKLLFDVDDIKMLIKQSKRTLRESFNDPYKIDKAG